MSVKLDKVFDKVPDEVPDKGQHRLTLLYKHLPARVGPSRKLRMLIDKIRIDE
jgi:hypothetical protein